MYSLNFWYNGSNGSQVVLLQDTLKKAGLLPQSIKSNGNFGSATLKAVQDFPGPLQYRPARRYRLWA